MRLGWERKEEERGGKLKHWNILVGVQREGSLVEHSGRKIPHNRCGLDGEIAEHFVGAPSAKKADDVRVHLGAEQSHCAGGS
jgi:hypothetical protein